MDSIGGQEIKVIPCMGPSLHETVAQALETPEPDWEQPKLSSTTRSGDWGSQRTVLFSGMRSVLTHIHYSTTRDLWRLRLGQKQYSVLLMKYILTCIHYSTIRDLWRLG